VRAALSVCVGVLAFVIVIAGADAFCCLTAAAKTKITKAFPRIYSRASINRISVHSKSCLKKNLGGTSLINKKIFIISFFYFQNAYIFKGDALKKLQVNICINMFKTISRSIDSSSIKML